MTELSQRLNQENEQDADHLEMRKHHITAWRYRVYIFVMFVIIVMIEPMFTSGLEKVRWKDAFKISFSDPISMHTRLWSGGKINDLTDLQTQIDQTNDEIATTKLQIEIVRNLETPTKQNTILNCINWQQCELIEVWLIDRMDLLRSFFMIEHLTTEKLDFDQKFVLRNINEFLATQIWRGHLVTIKDITFGTPSEVKPEYKLSQVPVNLTVSYLANTDFMAFLHNIETKISPELPVMRRIEAINYDIVNYLDTQEVTLSLTLYYINTPKQEQPAPWDIIQEAIGTWVNNDDAVTGTIAE